MSQAAENAGQSGGVTFTIFDCTKESPDAADSTAVVPPRSPAGPSLEERAALAEAQRAAIREEVEAAVPKIGDRQPLAEVAREYENSHAVFHAKMLELQAQHGYAALRRSQGDGNCFYRCVLFGLLEALVRATGPRKAALAAALRAVSLRAAEVGARGGLESFVTEGPCEALTELVGFATQPDAPMDGEDLVARFRSSGPAAEVAYALWLLRLSASAQLKAESDFYWCFIEGSEQPGEPPFRSVLDFCNRCVDAVETEADHVAITALCAALRLRVRVAYLDGGAGGAAGGQLVTFHEFGEAPPAGGEAEAAPLVHLLYRPGHYDLLYPEEEVK